MWNLVAAGKQIMRAADCKKLAEKPEGIFRQAPNSPVYGTGEFYMPESRRPLFFCCLNFTKNSYSDRCSKTYFVLSVILTFVIIWYIILNNAIKAANFVKKDDIFTVSLLLFQNFIYLSYSSGRKSCIRNRCRSFRCAAHNYILEVDNSRCGMPSNAVLEHTVTP